MLTNDLSKMLSKEIVIMDGATGTALENMGISTKLPLWSAEALLTNPDKVLQVHKDYISAGAQIITTNTFRTNSRTFVTADIKDQSKELTTLAVKLAKQAQRETNTEGSVLIAGSIAPLEDCYSPELVPSDAELQIEHSENVKNLINEGVDILLIETMNNIKEAKCILNIAQQYDYPIFLSFVATEEGRLLSGESFEKVVQLSHEFDISSLMINCTPAPNVAKTLSYLYKNVSVPLGVYANIGYVDHEKGWESNYALSPEEYLTYAREWGKAGARIVGGCCGTNKSYIEVLAKNLQ